MPTYIYQLKEWPHFKWDQVRVAERLSEVSLHQGRLLGRLESLGFELKEEAELRTLTEDVLKTSEIEGEILNRKEVRSSVARHLGIDIKALPATDRFVEGTVQMMLNATKEYKEPLTAERLFAWHTSLFPTGRSGLHQIKVGDWRDDKLGRMQVVSGPYGKEKVHYEAPPADQLAHEMELFLNWFNDPAVPDTLIKAAIAHLWFVVIHPFADGNGRIARAIADMVLARSERSSKRFYSMSAQIRLERNTYYSILKKTQQNNLDISQWLLWFLDCLERAFEGAEKILSIVLRKARFFEVHGRQAFNDRQKKILIHLIDGFEGKLTSSKWAKITKCSQDTATRDINDLIKRGILKKDPGGGRSTSYSLVEF
jgi:Fic family protein